MITRGRLMAGVTPGTGSGEPGRQCARPRAWLVLAALAGAAGASNPADEGWAQFGPGAAGVGWDSGLIGLYLHLTTRQAVDPAKMAEWSASGEGHRFLTASSDAWHEASVAFSTDPAEARAAAD
jgi:hypothetical protein